MVLTCKITKKTAKERIFCGFYHIGVTALSFKNALNFQSA